MIILTTHTLGYGDTMWEDEDGHIYLYTTSNYKVAVALYATRDLGSQWEYLCGRTRKDISRGQR